MQEEITAATLVLPGSPLYIVVALIIAITAMVAADIRDDKRSLSRSPFRFITIPLYILTTMAIFQITWSIGELNNAILLSGRSLFGLYLHSIILNVLLLVLLLWHVVFALHRETD